MFNVLKVSLITQSLHTSLGFTFFFSLVHRLCVIRRVSFLNWHEAQHRLILMPNSFFIIYTIVLINSIPEGVHTK